MNLGACFDPPSHVHISSFQKDFSTEFSLKVTGLSKNQANIGGVSPISTRHLFVKFHAPLNARVSGYLDINSHNLSPFCKFSIDFAYF